MRQEYKPYLLFSHWREMTFFFPEHIVLDLDGTLISEPFGDDTPSADIEGNFIPTPRPYLRGFLKFLFNNFDTVSIWTRASEGWWKIAYKNIIRHYMPEGKEFFKVWFGNRCKRDGEGLIFKPLDKMWKRKWKMNRDNTLIIDNDPENYVYNKKNAIPIDSYYGSREDIELLRVKNELIVKMYYSRL